MHSLSESTLVAW